MSRGFFVSCLVVAASAGLGYWIWSDAAPLANKTSALREVIDSRSPTFAEEPSEPERFTAGQLVEVIDLSRVFEPTGEELALQTLLNAISARDALLPPPREVGESLPEPRIICELLGFPRVDGEVDLPMPRVLGNVIPAGYVEQSALSNDERHWKMVYWELKSAILSVFESDEELGLKGKRIEP